MFWLVSGRYRQCEQSSEDRLWITGNASDRELFVIFFFPRRLKMFILNGLALVTCVCLVFRFWKKFWFFTKMKASLIYLENYFV